MYYYRIYRPYIIVILYMYIGVMTIIIINKVKIGLISINVIIP